VIIIINLNSLSVSLTNKLNEAVSQTSVENIIKGIIESLKSELYLGDRHMHRMDIIKKFINTEYDLPIHLFCRNYEINQRTFERFVLKRNLKDFLAYHQAHSKEKR
jgi:hypothetical protein